MESFRRWRNGAIASGTTLLVGIVILAISVFASSLVDHSVSDAASTDPSTSTSTTVATTSTTVAPPATKPIRALPVVGSERETAPVNTTRDPRTPASFVPFRHGGQAFTTWRELVDAVNEAHAQWYIDAVNNRAGVTGFLWQNIEKWANDPRLEDTTSLTIQVFGGSWSDDQARAIAAELVGPDLAAMLPIVHHDTGLLVNTRSVGEHEVGDFRDLRKMVRVSLSPVIYKDGRIIGVDGNSGIFADCYNIWHLAAPPTTPSTAPPTTSSVPPSCPPGTTGTPPNCLEAKPPGADPYPQGNAPTGGGANLDPGPGTYVPPEDMEQPPAPARVNPPPPPASVPPAGSEPDPTPSPAPEPDAPPPDDPSTGYSPPPGM